MGDGTFSWEVPSNLGMSWDSGGAEWTGKAFSRALHRSGWSVLSGSPEHCTEGVNVHHLPKGLREARPIPGFMMRLLQNLLNLSFLSIKPQSHVQISMAPLFLPQCHISSVPIRLPPLLSVEMPAKQSKDITENNLFVLSSATSFTARLLHSFTASEKQTCLPPDVYARVWHSGMVL